MVDFKRFILQVSSPAMCTKTHIAGFFVKNMQTRNNLQSKFNDVRMIIVFDRQS